MEVAGHPALGPWRTRALVLAIETFLATSCMPGGSTWADQGLTHCKPKPDAKGSRLWYDGKRLQQLRLNLYGRVS
eukprot:1785427-Pyramimonas_sp.AAC.1